MTQAQRSLTVGGVGSAVIAPHEVERWHTLRRILLLQARLRSALASAYGSGHPTSIRAETAIMTITDIYKEAGGGDAEAASVNAASRLPFHRVLIAVLDYERTPATQVITKNVYEMIVGDLGARARGAADARRQATREASDLAALFWQDTETSGFETVALDPGSRPAFPTAKFAYELERLFFVNEWLVAPGASPVIAPHDWLSVNALDSVPRADRAAAYRFICGDISRDERAAAEEGRYSGGLATFLAHLALAWARLWLGSDDAVAPAGARADADALLNALAAARDAGANAPQPQPDDDEANMPFSVEMLQLAIAEVERVRGQ